MINIKQTITNSIWDKFNKMRFLGENNPKSLKLILYLIILDDLYDWSNYLDEPQHVLKKLLDLRIQFVLKHLDLKTVRESSDWLYVNANTPLTDMTWKRVWDAPDVVNLYNKEITEDTPSHDPEPWTPDSDCQISITYFDNTTETGEPDIDVSNLTTCEKMNLYINRETGQMYYLDPETCLWKALKGQLLDNIDWNDINNKPTVYQGVQHTLGEESLTTELLTENSPVSTIDVAGEDEIDDVL